MEDFNEFYQQGQNQKPKSSGDLFNIINSFAKKYDGKSTKELIDAVRKEAIKGKQNGTLSNADLDKFVKMLSPFLDQKKKSILNSIVEELKKI